MILDNIDTILIFQCDPICSTAGNGGGPFGWIYDGTSQGMVYDFLCFWLLLMIEISIVPCSWLPKVRRLGSLTPLSTGKILYNIVSYSRHEWYNQQMESLLKESFLFRSLVCLYHDIHIADLQAAASAAVWCRVLDSVKAPELPLDVVEERHLETKGWVVIFWGVIKQWILGYPWIPYSGTNHVGWKIIKPN